MKKYIFKSILIATNIITPLLTYVGCSNNNEINDLYQDILKLDNVTKVETITNHPNYKAKFIIHFQQLLDPQDPDAGSFEQRVEFNYRSKSALNVFFVGGYSIDGNDLERPRNNRIIEHYQANCFRVEYRYFSQSSPAEEGVGKLWNPEYWKYATTKLALNDFHIILQQLKKIVDGKWIMQGASKGGQTTNAMACYYPDDFDGYVAMVPPLPFKIINESSSGDPNYLTSVDMCKWIYTEVGESILSDAELNLRRKNIATILYYALDNQNAMLSRLEEKIATSDTRITDVFMEHPMYLVYNNILCWTQSFWQRENWDVCQNLANEINDQSPNAEKDVFDLIVSGSADNDGNYTYWIQGLKEMGFVTYANLDLFGTFISDNLRKQEITKDVVVGKFNIANEDKEDFTEKYLHNQQIRDNITYDESLYNDLTNFFTTTSNANVIELHGGLDPWRAYYKKVEDWQTSGQLANNVHIFLCPEKSHTSVNIDELPEIQRQEAWSLLDQWIA